jgi:hypothetical protein
MLSEQLLAARCKQLAGKYSAHGIFCRNPCQRRVTNARIQNGSRSRASSRVGGDRMGGNGLAACWPVMVRLPLRTSEVADGRE